MNYLSIIKIALIIFPFIAFIISMPYILKEYHKYGSVYWYRALIVYSFVLYLLTAYFLVILPLPLRDEVLAITTVIITIGLSLLLMTLIDCIINPKLINKKDK